MKDLKWFHDENVEKPQEQQIYNFERAVSFNKGIRRLGIAEDGQSYLDLFRQLITHIGELIKQSSASKKKFIFRFRLQEMPWAT